MLLQCNNTWCYYIRVFTRVITNDDDEKVGGGGLLVIRVREGIIDNNLVFIGYNRQPKQAKKTIRRQGGETY